MNPLRRDGTSQRQRYPGPLNPTWVGIEEKETEDFLAFLEKFSTQVQYWDSSNTESGDWADFFRDDISVILASIIKTDLNFVRKHIDGLCTQLEKMAWKIENGYTVFGGDVDSAFTEAIFFIIYGGGFLPPPELGHLAIARVADGWNQRVQGRTDFDGELNGLVVSELSLRLKDVARLHFELGRDRAGFVPLPTSSDYAGFGSSWGDPEGYFSSLSGWTGTDFYKGNTESEKITYAAQSLRVLAESFFNILQVIQSRARRFFIDSLNNRDDHEPHTALLIAFLNLFRYAKNHLNELTGRHLDFFYQEVLRLMPRGPVPDKAHLIVRPRKNYESVRIEKGTLTEAGPDANGAERYYATEEEVVLNQAEVTELKTLFLTPPMGTLRPVPNKNVQVYAANKANSADGAGAALDASNPKWFTLGENQVNKLAGAHTMSDGIMGFAVSSPQLHLTNGSRYIRLIFTYSTGSAFHKMNRLQQANTEVSLVSSMRVKLTGEKGWVETTLNRAIILTDDARVSDMELMSQHLSSMLSDYPAIPLSAEVAHVNFNNEGVLILEVALPRETAPIVPYDPEVHEPGYDARHPLAVFTVDNMGVSITGQNAMFEFNYSSIIPLTSFNLGDDFIFHGNLFSTNVYTAQRHLTITEYLGTVIPTYDENASYGSGLTTLVLHAGNLYQSIHNSTSPPPDSSPDFWQPIGAGVPGIAPDYLPTVRYNPGQRVMYNEYVYEAVRASVSPDPERYPDYWKKKDLTVNLYAILRTVNPRKLRVKVDVRGFTNLLLENDNGPLNPDKPLEPFSFRPVKGSRFYIGSGEIFAKKVKTLSLNIEWLDVPGSDLAGYYNSGRLYAGGPIANNSFTCQVDLLHQGRWTPVQPGGLYQSPIFYYMNARLLNHIHLNLEDPSQAQSVIDAPYFREKKVMEIEEYSQSLNRGFMRLELTGPDMAFGHGQFNELYAAAMTSVTPPDIPTLPVEPYTPRLKSFSVDYTSEAQINLSSRSRGNFEQRVDQFFHIHPFGNGEAHASLLDNDTQLSLVPYYVDEGHLFIGLSKAKGLETVWMLFQLAEGSGDPDTARSEITWKYLSDNQWRSFAPGAIMYDSTHSLRTSGIIAFSLPADANANSSIMGPSRHWIRATLPVNTIAVNQAIAITAQAVPVTFLNHGNEVSHLRTSLPAKSIKNFKSTRIEVDSVTQPYSSFGGKVEEGKQEFHTRVSERLRHKDRSSTVWDYERMVLEQFPEIYKTKCINHTDEHCEISPGNVMVVTVPSLRNKNAVNIFEPRTSIDTLEEIRKYLIETVSPFVNLRVKNPLYEKIRVRCKVGFRAGYDPGFYANQLVLDIQKFLSPWAFEQGQDIQFGGRIHRSVILNFIEEREYVDWVVQFKMDHIWSDGTVCKDVLEAETTTSRSILVSASSHEIVPVVKCDCYCEGSQYYEGIGFWRIYAPPPQYVVPPVITAQ